MFVQRNIKLLKRPHQHPASYAPATLQLRSSYAPATLQLRSSYARERIVTGVGVEWQRSERERGKMVWQVNRRIASQTKG